MNGPPGRVTSGAFGERRMTHVPALDGIRGIAVLAVIAYHLDYLPGGYLGVDAFFVLSGFLITGLLVDELRFESPGRLDLTRFWTRRVKRLFPALAVLLLAVVLVESFVIGDPAPSLRRETLSAIFYVYNWNSLVEGVDYWSSFAAPSPLQHMWSLAIEEQFYILWPLVVVGVVWVARRRGSAGQGHPWRHGAVAAIGMIAAMLAIVSVVVAQAVHDPANVLRVYYGTDTRIAAILFGAAAAVVIRRLPALTPGVQQAIGAIGLVTLAPLAWAWITLAGTSEFLYRGGLVVTGLGTTFVICAVVVAPDSWLATAMSAAPLRWCGLVSYGLYLWHWPIIVWLSPERTGLDGGELLALRTVLTVGVTVASYLLVEQPLRKSSFGAGHTLRFGMLAISALAVLTLVVFAGVTAPIDQPDAGARSTLPIPPPPITTGPVTDPDPDVSVTSPLVKVPAPAPELRRLMVVGDSGAYFLGEELLAAAPPDVVVLPRGVIGCGIANIGGGSWSDDVTFLPDPEGCEQWPEDWASDAEAFQPDHVLIVLSWPGLGDRDIEGVRLHPCQAGFDALYADRLATAIDVAGSTGAEVVVATAPYYVATGNLPLFPERVDCLNEVMTETARASGATIVDLAAWTCPDVDECRTSQDGESLRPDGLHFAGPGGLMAADWTLERLGAGPRPPGDG